MYIYLYSIFKLGRFLHVVFKSLDMTLLSVMKNVPSIAG